jgi:hypothetical protein
VGAQLRRSRSEPDCRIKGRRKKILSLSHFVPFNVAIQENGRENFVEGYNI